MNARFVDDYRPSLKANIANSCRTGLREEQVVPGITGKVSVAAREIGVMRSALQRSALPG